MGFLSLKPKDAVAGGGLIDDLDVVIAKCRFGLWDYNGAIPAPIFALGVTFKDADGNQAEQWYSAGETKNHVPSEDGKRAQNVGKEQAGLGEGTNAMLFLASLVNSGFPEDKITDDVSVFEGCSVHVNRVPQPVRKGLTGSGQGKGDGKVLVVTKILSYPWDTTQAAPAGKTKKATAGAAAGSVAQGPTQAPTTSAPAADGEVQGKTVDAVMAVVASKGGSIAKSALAQEIFKVVSKDPNRNQIVQLAYSDAFLSAEGQPWQFDGTTISLG